MKWDDDLLLEESPLLRGQAQLAAYAIHLSTGATLQSRQIKVDTIKQYAFAASSFLALFSGTDYRRDHPTDQKFCKLLAAVYDDLKRYETVPDRREPYIPEMQEAAEKAAAVYRDKDPTNLICALTDGFAMALLAGFRLAEWAQHDGFDDPLNPMLNHLLPPNIQTRALCPLDFRAETSDRKRLVGLQILQVPLDKIRKVWCKFRTQKNGYHGEERLFTRNNDNTNSCFVSALYRSLQRFQLIQKRFPSLPETAPLSVYWDSTHNRPRLIQAKNIETFMRGLAVQVHQLHPEHDKKELQKFSAHSLRVGACVLLHAMGFSTLDIKFLLRWRSEAFMAYLRNLTALGDRQHKALDAAKSMPHLF